MTHPRLLVVDDHPDTLRLFETCLSLAGFDVISAANAVDHPVLILADIQLPGIDGLEFIRRMRADRTPPIPIVAVTGQPIAPSVVAADLGCCRLVSKPCDLGALAETLHLLVGTCPHDCTRCQHRSAASGRIDLT